jgi:ABC-type dipeptide/oligopeptide/nickel transport system ATPase component
MTGPLLQVSGLATHFFTRAGVAKAVDGVDLAVDRGRILGLVGESGSGKSVTGFSILGLVDPLASSADRSGSTAANWSACRPKRCASCAASGSPWSSRTR